MADIHSILNQYWGYNRFRPLQEDVISSVLSGEDTLALMPTGGGKSLCYQVPALAMEGMCLVISPLIALMKDQVENLRKKGITAYSIHSGMSRRDVIQTLKVVTESNCKFLYVSPERLGTALFKEYLPGMFVNLIAVDEAHCISQWGYDFRPSYLKISELREELRNVPVLALTASAVEEVQNDICEKLAFQKKKIFRQSFERPNLSYSVFRVDSKPKKVIDIMKRIPGSGIVYCKSRKRTKEISELLQLEGISADFYHAGLTYEERNKKQEDWVKNKTKVIVCTNAFGMGIDKPDVRTVVHADITDCLENYYQEAGRAGRDGKTSFAVLLYDNQDLEDLEQLPDQRFPSLQKIKDVYHAVVNYLQIPAGAGEGKYYDFDLVDFIKKFRFSSYTALYSLKALEQEGCWAFNEQIFLAASIRFATNKESLYNFEQSQPALEPLIKTLLRSYEGIFNYPVSVSEKMIAGLLKKDLEEVKKQLTDLHRAGIIEYNPQKDSPQLLLLRNRIRSEDITINSVVYNKRKEKLKNRIGQIIKYVKEGTECRSRIIASYFGDPDVKPCGICDNCLRRKGATLNKEEFEAIHHRIINIVKYESLPVNDLLQKLSGVKKEKAWKVIEFLQAEQKIEMNTEGWVVLK
jgi:ATP-dependent DNA helicase RecQ